MTTLGKIAIASRQMSEAAHSIEECEEHGSLCLCCFAVVVIQESTKPLTPLCRPSFGRRFHRPSS
jgi:hypothetical protein